MQIADTCDLHALEAGGRATATATCTYLVLDVHVYCIKLQLWQVVGVRFKFIVKSFACLA